MAVTIDGAGPLAGATTLNGLTIPTTGFGKVLQVVRATDTTERTTTSASFVDASISVTITPQKSTSAIIILWISLIRPTTTGISQYHQITDNSNSAISGAELMQFVAAGVNHRSSGVLIGYSTPATTSATTYKGRFRVDTGTARIGNDVNTGQLYAIEVSA